MNSCDHLVGGVEKQASFSGPNEASVITLDTNVAPTDQFLSNKGIVPHFHFQNTVQKRANAFPGQK